MTTIAGPTKEVSEKSLELNVCAETLQYIRAWPGCQRALWLGLTQRQERRTGLDELIRSVGPGFGPTHYVPDDVYSVAGLLASPYFFSSRSRRS